MKTVSGFVAEVGDITRFDNPKQLQKLAGYAIANARINCTTAAGTTNFKVFQIVITYFSVVKNRLKLVSP